MLAALPYVVIAAANVLIYREYWSAEKLFTGSDLLTAFGPLLNFQTDCLRDFSWPYWNPYMNFGYPFIEHYSNTAFFPTHLFMGIFTGSNMHIIQCEILLWIVVGGFGIYLCSRELGSSHISGIMAGVSFMFCGQLLALPQWHLLVYNAACFPYMLLGYHRAKRSVSPFSIVAIVFLSMSIFGGHITTTVLGIYIFILYVIIESLLGRRFLFGSKFLIVTLLVSMMLVLPKIGPLYQALRLGPRMNAPAIFQNPHDIVNLYNFMSFVLPVKFYFSLYIGEISILALLYASIRRELKINALLVTFFLTAWLLMVDDHGELSLLRKVANALPLMRLVRNEWFEWFFPTIFAILYLVKYVDAFFLEREKKYQLAATILLIILLTLVYITSYDTKIHLSSYLIHAAIVFLWLSIVFVTGLRKKLQFLLAVVIVIAEFYVVFDRVNIDDPPIRYNKQLVINATDQTNSSQLFTDGERVANRMRKIALQDEMRPSISDSRARPVLSSGLDGNFIDSMNQKRFAGWWFNAQERYDFIRLKESPLLAQMEGQPLFALFDAETGQPVDRSVGLDNITCSRFDFTVAAPRSGFLLLNQFYDDRWRVFTDGRQQPVIRANEFFMGIEVPPGQHHVKFVFRDRLFIISLIISIFTSLGIALYMIFFKTIKSGREKQKAAS